MNNRDATLVLLKARYNGQLVVYGMTLLTHRMLAPDAYARPNHFMSSALRNR